MHTTSDSGTSRRIVALVMTASLWAVTGLYLLALGFGRYSACTSDPAGDCGDLERLLTVAHVANVVVAVGSAAAVMRARNSNRVVAVEAVLSLAIVVLATLMSSRGWVWGDLGGRYEIGGSPTVLPANTPEGPTRAVAAGAQGAWTSVS